MKTETQNLFRVAIVGGASLKGKELKDVLEERNFPAAEIKLLDDDESLGQLERVQDEVALVQPVGRDELAQMDFTFFASEEEFTRKKWKLARVDSRLCAVGRRPGCGLQEVYGSPAGRRLTPQSWIRHALWHRLQFLLVCRGGAGASAAAR